MKFIIDEHIEQELFKSVIVETFYPTTELVLQIKNYLDKNFAKTEIDDIGENGYPIKIKSAVLLSDKKQPLKTLQPRELLMLLDDNFHKIITNDDDRKKFLKQVIRDWFNGKISKEGVLSVNLVK